MKQTPTDSTGSNLAMQASEILRGKILIVDDQEANVLLLERLLRLAGYTSVTSTMDSSEVCASHSQNRYDLILLDLEMPGMDGFQVLEALRRIAPDDYLPVLVLTAHPDHKLAALRAGAKDFLSKPFDHAEVLMRVHNILEVRLLHLAALNHGRVLEALALNDPLTGLANRRLLADRLCMALAHARRKKRLLAVIYFDLDEFKPVNDVFGHGVGDDLLKMVAARLLATARQEDTVARLGGDEFAILLSEVDAASSAATVASKAIALVSKPYDIQGRIIHITMSAGIGLYPAHGDSADTLIKSADLALYEAKRAGKNAFRVSRGPGLSTGAHGQTDSFVSDTPIPGGARQ